MKLPCILLPLLLTPLFTGCEEAVRIAKAEPDEQAGETELMRYCKDEDLCDVLEELADAGSSTVNKRDAAGRTALYWAAQNGSVEIVQELLKAGASPMMRSKKLVSPLLVAAQGGHSHVVRLLLAAGANPQVESEDGMTFLLAAAHGGLKDTVEDLLNIGGDPKAQDNNHTTLLMHAARSGNAALVRHLLEIYQEKEISPLDKDKNGRSALSYAAESGNVETLELLWKKGFNPTETDKDGKTLLMYVAGNGNKESVFALKFLLDHHADLKVRDKEGRTVLSHTKVELGGNTLDEILLDAGCEYAPNGPEAAKAFLVAMKRGDAEQMARLLEGGLAPDEKAGGFTLLQHSADFLNAKAARLLIDAGADFNRYYTEEEEDDDEEDDRINPAAIAIQYEPINVDQTRLKEYFQTLFDSKLDPTRGDLIRLAVYRDDEELIRMLAGFGAPVQGKGDYASDYPLGVAIICNKPNLFKLLLELGAKPPGQEDETSSVDLTEYAIMLDRVEILDILLKAGANPNRRTSNGKTYLHKLGICPPSEKDKAMAKLLRDAGADPNLKDDKGESALDLFRKPGNEELLKLFLPEDK